MSVRNIRNHHTRGLLPPPEVRARVGYYSAEHVARLRLIQDLQADGFNLAAIERLLSGSEGLAERLLGLRSAVTAPFEPETPEVVTRRGTRTALRRGRRQGPRAGPQAQRCWCRSGRTASKSRARRCWRPPSRCWRSASRCARARAVERVSRDCDSISRAFTKLFLKELWEPFEQAGQPEERWDELIERRRLAAARSPPRRCSRCSSSA